MGNIYRIHISKLEHSILLLWKKMRKFIRCLKEDRIQRNLKIRKKLYRS